MREEAGFTMVEVVVMTSVVALVMSAAATAALPALAREKLRSATYELQSTLQVSRVEAIARNSPTRFVLNQESRTAEAWDTMGTSDPSDDKLLRRISLPRSVSIARPDFEAAVTMGEAKSASVREVEFSADGSAPGATGEIALYGGGQYRKLDLQAAGSVAVDKWIDDGWEKVDVLEEAKQEQDWDTAREGYVDDWVDKLGEVDPTDPREDYPTIPDLNEPGTDDQTWPDDTTTTDPPKV